MNNIRTLFGLCFLVTALGAQAEPIKVDMKAGLWQNDIKMLGNSASQLKSLQNEQMQKAMEDMKKQLANMPPEQRKQMEQYMAQAGMKMDDKGMSFQNDKVTVTPTATSVKSCVTQSEIDRGEMPDKSENCKSTLTQLSKNRIKSVQVCGGEDPSTMESEITFESSKHFTGKGRMSQSVEGKPYVFEVALEGLWLSSDCGNIAPDDIDE